MMADPFRQAPEGPAAASALSLEERLERAEVVYFPTCPFPLPQGDDRQFLLEQQLASRAHKNISFNPHTRRANGLLRRSAEQAERLRGVLETFAHGVTQWVAQQLPQYAKGWRLDQVSFRPVEEATRKLRFTARNDLLHVDAFPSRPTNGWRILRVFANVNPTEPRIWVTSDPFPRLLERFGSKVGLPAGPSFSWRLRQKVDGFLHPGRPARSAYDAFMLRFHDFLKLNEEFQERCRKRYWAFAPGSAWMCFTDTVSHAALRGRFALEHSYFVPPHALAFPELSPPAVLERMCGKTVLNAA